MSQLCQPNGVLVSNGEVFICDTFNHRVRKILRNGQIVTICGTGVCGSNGDGQPAINAQLSHPFSLAITSSNHVYISDMKQHCIRMIDSHGVISTIAGNGNGGFNGDDQLAIHATLNNPRGLCQVDGQILFCDSGNHRVRKINRWGMISTICGNGKDGFNGDGQLAINSSLSNPSGVFQCGNDIYIADTGNGRIRKIDRHGIISTIAGVDTKHDMYSSTYSGDGMYATEVSIHGPLSVLVHNDHIYYSDSEKHRVRKIDRKGIVTTLAGNGKSGTPQDSILARKSKLNCPSGMFMDESNCMYIADRMNSCIEKVDEKGFITIIAGTIGNLWESFTRSRYSGDVPFDFGKYPHIGPTKKQFTIKPFPKAYHDLIISINE